MKNIENNNDIIPSSYYPYGELPLKYTKQGQEILKQRYEEKFKNNNIETVSTQNVEAKNINENDNFDFKSILPLLSTINGNDAIKQIIPLLNNNSDLNMADLLKLFTSMKKTSGNNNINKNKISNDNYIDNLKKIE